MSKKAKKYPDWEEVLTSAARFQQILPEAVLVGGTASALYVNHRLSFDADHTLSDLRERFDEILTKLESISGWYTSRSTKPVLILGNLDGIETGVRQLIRQAPLETVKVEAHGVTITVPSEAEILRIKAVLILKRNAIRDYIDFLALGDHLGDQKVVKALQSLDSLYPQKSGESALQQLLAQISNPLPFDLDEVNLSEYKNLKSRWQDWENLKTSLAHLAQVIFKGVAELPDHD